MAGVAIPPKWDFIYETATMRAIELAARFVSAKYKGRAVNMLAEYEDMLQEALILVATKERLQNLDPALLRFRLVQELNGLVRNGAERANSTVYTSTLEAA